MMIALLVAAGMNFSAIGFPTRCSADVQRPGGGPAGRPELYGMVQELCRRANLRCPRCMSFRRRRERFATGRNPEHAAVAVTEGLLQRMNREKPWSFATNWRT